MDENPYSPPTSYVATVTDPLWKSILRVAVFLYGCAFSAIVVYGHVTDTYDWSAFEIVLLVVSICIDLMTCYGIFALAFRALRQPSLYPVWRIFVWILPVFTVTEAIWEFSSFAAEDAEEGFLLMAIGLPLVLVISGPAMVCNFVLAARLAPQRLRDALPTS